MTQWPRCHGEAGLSCRSPYRREPPVGRYQEDTERIPWRRGIRTVHGSVDVVCHIIMYDDAVLHCLIIKSLQKYSLMLISGTVHML